MTPAVAAVIKSSIAYATFVIASTDVLLTVIAGVNDLTDSHEAPLLKEHQIKWKAPANTFFKISGSDTSYTPCRMEEFLYEKPFANIRAKSDYSSDWEEDKTSYTLGFYIGDSLEPYSILAEKLSNPLTFKSTSDWETLGAKKERWEIVNGIGNDSIPIRHADRYPMPSVMVKDFIHKYEFEIDDLMPHRLRQIRLNFNFMKA